MRTTCDLEDDVLLAVKQIARQRGVSVGKALSDLVRQTLSHREGVTERNGIPLFPVQPEASVVTLELINQLRDESS